MDPAKKKASQIADRYSLKLEHSSKDIGQFQYNTLAAVVARNFEESIKIVKEYQQKKLNYPQFNMRTKHIFSHIFELLEAIKAKKNLPNLENMPESKQEEVHIKALEHFEELKRSLKRVRDVERGLAFSDARSSVWVLRALLFSVFAIILTFFAKELFGQFGRSFPRFSDDASKIFFSIIDEKANPKKK